MSDPAARTFSSDFKRFFLRGLVVLLPSVLTLWIVVKAYQFVDGAIAEPINLGVRITMNNLAPYWEPLREKFDPTDVQLNAAIAERAVSRGVVHRGAVQTELRLAGIVSPTEEQLQAAIAQRAIERRAINPVAVRSELRANAIQTWWAERWYMNLIGLAVAIIAVYVAGRLLGGFVGRRVYRKLESLLTTIPVFKQVYPHVKQVVDFLFSDEQPIKFNRVVIVEYPRKGIWSLGFQTGESMRAIGDHLGDAVTVFIPSSPTPFTGYTITVPRSEVIEAPISVEEALRFTVSGGVLVPQHPAKPGCDDDNDDGPGSPGQMRTLPGTGLVAIPGTATDSPISLSSTSSSGNPHVTRDSD